MSEPKVLRLTLKRKWFDLIAAGKKNIEYREFKEYWKIRLMLSGSKLRDDFDEVHFRNGYSPDAPFMKVNFDCIRVIQTRHHHAANDEPLTDSRYFAIYLGSVIEIKNYE